MKSWKEYSAFEWLLIDLASRYGYDKLPFDERIKWSAEHLVLFKVAEDIATLKQVIQHLIDKADEPAMFAGCALAVWDALNGRKSNWQVGQDAASSGPQLLSVMMRCETGMSHTGVLQEDVPDLYTDVTEEMNRNKQGSSKYKRSVVKKGIVPHVYASTAEPKRVFKKGYSTFLKAYRAIVPMAQEASDIMVKIWNSNALEHCWYMPDGAYIRIPVIVQKDKTIPCGNYSFKYIYQEVGTKKKGESGTKSLSANITHSYDAYILRELNRRCNYNTKHIQWCMSLLKRSDIKSKQAEEDTIYDLEKRFYDFNQKSAVAFEYLTEANVGNLTDDFRAELLFLAEDMLKHEPFEISNIHDEFKTLPKNVCRMKEVYNILLVETYFSNWWVETIASLSGSDFSLLLAEPTNAIEEQMLKAPYSIG